MSTGAVRRTLVGLTLAAATMLDGRGLHLVSNADAVVGRPLTPVSYAGVARRTTRRMAYAGAASAAAAATVTTLPPGCARVQAGATVTYSCGGVAYAPVYDGGTVVYVQQ